MQQLTQKGQELLKFLQVDYINHGYMYSGSWPYNSLLDRGFGKEHMKELEAAGLIQRRNCNEFAYELTAAERSKLIGEYDLPSRWKSSAGRGLFHSINEEVRSVKAATPKKESLRPSLASLIRSAEKRSSGKSDPLFILKANEDRTWSVSVSTTTDAVEGIPFVEEKDYPVRFYFRRTDMNGSGVVEAETYNTREDLLQALNWMGKAGFVPLELWDFDVETTNNEPLMAAFHAGEARRFDRFEEEWAEILGDEPEAEEDLPVAPTPKAPEHSRSSGRHANEEVDIGDYF